MKHSFEVKLAAVNHYLAGHAGITWLNCTPNVGHNLTSEGAVYETFI
ncbi:hypothetical protein [Escherichia coli]|nr:hypothetical protein [Escherichia coli]